MEMLFTVNPKLLEGRDIIIYGISERECSIFHQLLQQNVYVTAFCRKIGDKSTLNRLFNKRVIQVSEMAERYKEALVVVSGVNIIQIVEDLKAWGICNIVAENLSISKRGILLVEE